MHSLCLVVGEGHQEALEPFSDHLEVERYRVFLEESDREAMASHFSVPAEDVATLAAKMPEWQEAEGGVENGRLFFWSTENPQGKFDWYRVGGRFDGYLQLAEPRPPGFLARLFGKGPIRRVNRARKREVFVEPILAEPPTSMVHGGVWHECPLTHDAALLETWKQDFAGLFSAVAAEEWLTVIDLHS